MKLKKVPSTKKADGGYYYKYSIAPIPKEIAENSGLVDKEIKAKVEKGKIIIEKK